MKNAAEIGMACLCTYINKNLPLLRGMKPFHMIKHGNAIEKAILDQQEHFIFHNKTTS